MLSQFYLSKTHKMSHNAYKSNKICVESFEQASWLEVLSSPTLFASINEACDKLQKKNAKRFRLNDKLYSIA